MKRIKKAVIILVLIIIIILGVIVFINKKDTYNTVEEEPSEELEEGLVRENNENGFKIIQDANVFYSITNVLSNYLQVISYNGETDIEENPYGIEDDEEMKEIMMSMLDVKYVSENNISDSYEGTVDLIDYDYNIIPIDMRVNRGDSISTYIVDIYLENIEDYSLEEKYYIVRVDSQNGTFSIEPIEEEVENIDAISVEETNMSIEKNEYNAYDIEIMSTEGLVRIYLNNFITMLLNHTDIVYERYLDEEYRDKRFENLQELEEYVERNNEEIQSVSAEKYLIEDNNETNEYVIMDQYGNIYEFYEISTMVYKVRMDNYTIASETFITTYNSSNEQNRVMLNIDKWIKMLNNRDYSAAYEVLDETYRENTFGSQDEFESYMRQNMPLHYDVNYESFETRSGVYVQTISLTDITEESEDIVNLTIIMDLLEDMDFKMSFNIS